MVSVSVAVKVFCREQMESSNGLANLVVLAMGSGIDESVPVAAAAFDRAQRNDRSRFATAGDMCCNTSHCVCEVVCIHCISTEVDSKSPS